RLLFAVGPVVVFRWQNRESWPVEYVSPNIEALTGYPVEEFASGRRGCVLVPRTHLAAEWPSDLSPGRWPGTAVRGGSPAPGSDARTCPGDQARAADRTLVPRARSTAL